ncbi:hypothetical protein [Rufibacter soli]
MTCPKTFSPTEYLAQIRRCMGQVPTGLAIEDTHHGKVVMRECGDFYAFLCVKPVDYVEGKFSRRQVIALLAGMKEELEGHFTVHRLGTGLPFRGRVNFTMALRLAKKSVRGLRIGELLKGL